MTGRLAIVVREPANYPWFHRHPETGSAIFSGCSILDVLSLLLLPLADTSTISILLLWYYGTTPRADTFLFLLGTRMDQVFAQLALTTVTLVGKAAFGAAGSMAVRHLHSYYEQQRQQRRRSMMSAGDSGAGGAGGGGGASGGPPLGGSHSQGGGSHSQGDALTTTTQLLDELMELQRDLEAKMAILTPTIDLLELVAARGHSRILLEPVLALTADLKRDLDRLTQYTTASTEHTSTSTSTGLALALGVGRLSLGGGAGSGGSSGASGSSLSASASGTAKARRASQVGDTPLSPSVAAASPSPASPAPPTTTTTTLDITHMVRRLLRKMESIVPYLQLALTTSGVSLSTSLPAIVSPSGLHRAFHFLSLGHERYRQLRADNHHQEVAMKKSTGSSDSATKRMMMAVPPKEIPVLQLSVRVYTLFVGSMRKSNISWTWKEWLPRATVELVRMVDFSPSSSSASSSASASASTNTATNTTTHTDRDKYRYMLRVIQDWNDGRYHEDEDKERRQQRGLEPAASFPVTAIEKMYFSTAGKLLMIEDSKRPTLLLKVWKQPELLFVDSSTSSSTSASASKSTPRRRNKDDPTMPEPHIRDYHWYALELWADDADGGSDDDESATNDDDNDDDSSNSNGNSSSNEEEADGETWPRARSKAATTARSARRTTATTTQHAPSHHPTNPIDAHITTLDYVLRLSALEEREQKPLWEIRDEWIFFFLQGDHLRGGPNAPTTTATTNTHTLQNENQPEQRRPPSRQPPPPPPSQQHEISLAPPPESPLASKSTRSSRRKQ